ncbi:hypothetical protein CEXT_154501 [Caerostris extrusa]|uniref:Uncharacterized protein n=1 Tax=Caerostris extrusa TaxID=172846 RepID=A0AAV4QFW2_CAEEX|nr:hypothetical protein CEXT_154501 [Caerostris extrusa]
MRQTRPGFESGAVGDFLDRVGDSGGREINESLSAAETAFQWTIVVGRPRWQTKASLRRRAISNLPVSGKVL